jgi:hypothetical protein
VRARSERGASALEFGLVAPLMFLLIFGLIQYGYLFWSLTTASATAREAARRMVVGHDWDTCAVPHAVAHARQPALGAGGVRLTHRFTDTAGNPLAREPAVGDLVEVTVSFRSLSLGIPLLPMPEDGEVSQTARARVESIPALPLPCTDEVPGT